MTTIEFNKKLKCGNDFVAVEVIDTMETLKIGNIYLPDTYGSNERLARCKVADVGKNAEKILGIKPGDYIMIDRLSTFAWTAPSAALKYDSVICKTNEAGTEFYPIKDTVFVAPDEKKDITDVDGVMVVNYESRLNLGTVLNIGFETSDEYPFKNGDRVMLVKGGDKIKMGDKTVYIYKKDMLVCTIEEK